MPNIEVKVNDVITFRIGGMYDRYILVISWPDQGSEVYQERLSEEMSPTDLWLFAMTGNRRTGRVYIKEVDTPSDGKNVYALRVDGELWGDFQNSHFARRMSDSYTRIEKLREALETAYHVASVQRAQAQKLLAPSDDLSIDLVDLPAGRQRLTVSGSFK